MYRHFPRREDLVAALVDRVSDEIRTLTAGAIVAPGGASATLERLGAEGVAIGAGGRS